MNSRSLCAAIMLVAVFTANAQEELKERGGGIFGLGVGVGYDNVRGNPGIQGQFVISGLADVTLGPRTFVNCRLGYSRYARHHYWIVQSYQEDFFWKNVSVTSAVFHRLSCVGSIGLGVGLDWIGYKVVAGEDFSSDREGNKMGLTKNGGDAEWKRLAPSFSALTNAEFVLAQGARIIMQCYMKFSYVGRPQDGVNYYLVHTTGVSVAFMRDVLE